MKNIRIGNAAGFWGDSPAAPKQLVQRGELDYLTLEYLAELTLSILAHQKKKQPDLGFVSEVPRVAAEIAEQFLEPRLRLVTNGGGMNPNACASAVSKAICEQSPDLQNLPIGICAGDDLLPRLDELLEAGESFTNLETGTPLSLIRDRIASANVYLGAAGIVEALRQDARIVLTGRVADASLTTGPAIHEFGWGLDDYHRLGAATVAGHLIECGAQVTGGIFSRWESDLSLGDIGYPIAIVNESGDCQITKPEGTGGVVSTQTCAEQLVYEIGDPSRYMTPDVIADFTDVCFVQTSPGVVSATGGTGVDRPDQLKVSLAYYDGFVASGMIVIAGRDAPQKAKSAGAAVENKLKRSGVVLDEFNCEVLGAGGSAPGMNLGDRSPWEVVLRVSGRSQDRSATDQLIREIAPLVTSGPPGVTGYTGARGKSMPVLSFWPALISREYLQPTVEVRAAKDWR